MQIPCSEGIRNTPEFHGLQMCTIFSCLSIPNLMMIHEFICGIYASTYDVIIRKKFVEIIITR
jgi:hypothetical protein